MKKLIYLLVALVLVSYTGMAGKRIMLNTATGTVKEMGNASALDYGKYAPAATFGKTNFSSPEFNSNLSMPEAKGDDLPQCLKLAYESVYITTWRDTSDSGFIYTSKLDPTKRVLTGFYDFPTGMGPFGSAVGAAQFVPNLPGTLLIDTVRLYMFVPTGMRAVRNSYNILPVYIKNFNLNDTAAVSAHRGISFDFNGNDFEILPNGDLLEIKADSLNNRLVYNGGQVTAIKYLFIKFDPPLRVENNNNFGFVIYQNETNQDSVRIVGVYEWNLNPVQTYGCIMRRNNNNDTVHSTYQYFWNFTAESQPYYRPLHGRSIRTNYEMVVFGDYEMGVEQLTPNADSFTLEQCNPNPASDVADIKFSVNQSAYVTINVYNTMGQLVSSLVNEKLAPGTYSKKLDVNNLPQGAYIYTMQAGSHSASKVLNVVK